LLRQVPNLRKVLTQSLVNQFRWSSVLESSSQPTQLAPRPQVQRTPKRMATKRTVMTIRRTAMTRKEVMIRRRMPSQPLALPNLQQMQRSHQQRMQRSQLERSSLVILSSSRLIWPLIWLDQTMLFLRIRN